MERFVQDLKYSLRALRKQRAFTFAAVAALALGIGATTAVFSVVNAVLLRPFPYPDPDRIVMFMNTSPNGSGSAASPAKFSHWRRQDAVVQDASAFRDVIVNYTGGDTPEQLRSGNVTRVVLPAVRRHADSRPDVHRRGGSTERRARRGALVWMVDAPLRVGSQRHRQDDPA